MFILFNDLFCKTRERAQTILLWKMISRKNSYCQEAVWITCEVLEDDDASE